MDRKIRSVYKLVDSSLNKKKTERKQQFVHHMDSLSKSRCKHIPDPPNKDGLGGV